PGRAVSSAGGGGLRVLRPRRCRLGGVPAGRRRGGAGRQGRLVLSFDLCALPGVRAWWGGGRWRTPGVRPSVGDAPEAPSGEPTGSAALLCRSDRSRQAGLNIAQRARPTLPSVSDEAIPSTA